MTDSSYTPALFVLGIALGILLSAIELFWLKRPYHWGGSPWALITLTLINLLFILIMIPVENSYLYLFVLPIPLIPTAYVVMKGIAYFAIGRITGTPLHSPVKVVFGTLFFHTAVTMAAYVPFSAINPTRSNLQQAIRDKYNWKLDTMLWISVRSEPNMTILVNEAISDGNDDAVRRLIRRGADVGGSYRFSDATRETQWQLTKWYLDSGAKPEDFAHMDRMPPFEEIAVKNHIPDLEYCFKKGFDPRKYPDVITTLINEQPLIENDVLQPGLIQELNDKLLILLKHGADINGKDRSGFPPILHLMFQRTELPAVLSLLIEKGANINVQSPAPIYPNQRPELPPGLTPLMLAAMDKHSQYVAILVKSGADKTLRDTKGLSAMDYAKKENAGEAILRLLE